MPPADSMTGLACCPSGLSQRLEIKGLKFFRFGNHALFLSVCAFTPEGRAIATASAELHVNHPKPGWATYDPSNIWRATAKVIAEVSRSISGSFEPQAIAVSSMVALQQLKRSIKRRWIVRNQTHDSRALAEYYLREVDSYLPATRPGIVDCRVPAAARRNPRSFR
jgi:hypothetical protein